jgi:anti-sigma factor RsiW
MPFYRMKQSDFADLCAYIDGQLEGPRSAQVQEFINSDAAWREAYRQMTQLDQLLQACEAPQAPADLAGRIIRRARGQRSHAILKFIRYAAPLAAAAAIVIGILVWQGRFGTSQHGTEVATVAKGEKSSPQEDRKVVEDLAADNLDFFKDYDVVSNLDTLEAIDRLEASQGS